MKVAALLLSVLLGCAAVAPPCVCICLASLRRQPRGEAIPAFNLGPLFLLRPHLSLPSSGSRGGQAQGAHHRGEEMGRYFALRWGPKGRTILRSLNALHAILQDLEGSSSSSGGSSSTTSSGSSDGPLSDCWQVAAYPSLEEAEAWLDQEEVQQQNARAKRRLVGADGGDMAAVSVQPSEGEKPTGGKLKTEIVTVFADGACSANGKAEARAGIGVYFGPGDPRNVSLPLSEGPQTNQRAELAAILAALLSFAYAEDTAAAAAEAARDRHSSVCPKQQGETGKRQRQEEGEETEVELHLHCDSNYAVQCVGPWADRWEANGWKTAAGTSVSNADLIKTIRRLMRQRRETPPSGARWRGRVRFFLVRGHSGVQGNEAADALAVRGAQMHAALKEQETGKQQDTKGTLLQHVLQALRAACTGTHRAA